jgi:hypothetical protein
LTAAVISKSFTAFDGWTNVTGAGLCSPCAWGYTEPTLRISSHLADRSVGTFTRLSTLEVGAILHYPIPHDQALVVPLRPGRKHVLPTAVWGRVTVDDGAISWTTADVDRFKLLVQFRDQGFGPRLLSEPAPAWPILRRLTPIDRRHTMATWPALAPWRVRPQWLRLAIYASPTSNRNR